MSITFQQITKRTAVISIQRPEVMNALNLQSITELCDILDKTPQSPELAILILTGTEKAFIAGGDLNEFHSLKSEEDGNLISNRLSFALERMHNAPYISIAAVNGPAYGGGAEIALACDMRVVSEDAIFGFVQIDLGLTPGWGGGTRLLSRVGYSKALEWLTLGRKVAIDELEANALVTRRAMNGGAFQAAIQLAEELEGKPQEVLKSLKEILVMGDHSSLQMAKEFERTTFPCIWASEIHHKSVERKLKTLNK